MMKRIILLLLFPILCYGQQFDIGLQVSPVLTVQNVDNLRSFSLSPQLSLSCGNDMLKVEANLGIFSSFGFVAMQKHSYAAGRYIFNSLETFEHGVEIETGYVYNSKAYKIQIGAAIGYLSSNGKDLDIFLKPICLSFKYKLCQK